jgi:NMD protein affecting ribosome stability and mRNA decay
MMSNKPTVSQYDDKAEYIRQWRALNKDKCQQYSNKDKNQKKWLKTRYGLTLEDWNMMFEEQGGVCAICKSPDPKGHHGRFHVDHDHVTGKIRGLLCDTCNRGIGMFYDSPVMLRSAATYLEKFDESRTH